MLTIDQQKTMIEERVHKYERAIFDLKLTRAALASIGDESECQKIDIQIDALKKSITAVRGMLDADSDADGPGAGAELR